MAVIYFYSCEQLFHTKKVRERSVLSINFEYHVNVLVSVCTLCVCVCT